jgi:quinol-cytochrome oxidoreductase complex cytochrome b subunit
MLLFSVLGLHQFIDFSTRNETLSLTIPLLIGSVGVFLNFLVGELDRKKLVKTKSDRPYKFSFLLSVGIMIFAIVLGGIMNPEAVFTTLSIMPFIAVGVVVFVFVALGVWIFSARGFSIDSKKEPLIV